MLSIIAAISENRVIGNENKLLWKIPEDMQRFKRLTTGHPIIMGRKTYESIGRPLRNRTNIIITRDQNYKAQDCIVVHSLEEAIEKAKKCLQRLPEIPGIKGLKFRESPQIFIIGGGQIYAQAINFADKLYLTVVRKNFAGDAVFPDYSRFNKIVSQEDKKSGEYEYTFLELEPL